MDLYGLPSSDFFGIDDLLDFSNEELFSSITNDSDNLPPPDVVSGNRSLAVSGNRDQLSAHYNTDFTDDLCVPVSITADYPLFFFSLFWGNFV